MGLMDSVARRANGCGQLVRRCGVKAHYRYEGQWVWSVGEKLWG